MEKQEIEQAALLSADKRQRLGRLLQAMGPWLLFAMSLFAFVLAMSRDATSWRHHYARVSDSLSHDGVRTLLLLFSFLGLLAALIWAWRHPRTPHGKAQAPLALHVAVLLAASLVVALSAAWLLWRGLDTPPVRKDTVLDVKNTLDALKIILAIVAGIGAVVGLTIAYRKQNLHETAERREETKQFTERFGQACNLIGDSSAAVRLAGVYAMAAVADAYGVHQRRQTCIDVLCAYLRMPYTPPVDDEPSAADRQLKRSVSEMEWEERQCRLHEEREIRRTVIHIIAAHLRIDDPTSWRDHDLDFSAAIFDRGDFDGVTFAYSRVSFENARFVGPVSFHKTRFVHSRVDFTDATFAGDVSFRDVSFLKSKMYFHRAQFTAGHTSFNVASFETGLAYFGGACFDGSEVTFHGADFNDGTVDMSQPGSWSVPPKFDQWINGVPEGLSLPAVVS